ncbi:MAG: hypothetical protein AB1Z19_04445 [Eubacteriales bacterium]
MRKASMILGILGGAIAILIALIIIGSALFFTAAVPVLMDSEFYGEEYNNYDSIDFNVEKSFGFVIAFVTSYGGGVLLSGILGLTGGLLVPKHNVLAAVLMLLGSAITLILFYYGIIPFLLMLLGGIFALVTDNNAPAKPTFDPNFE